MENNTGLLCTSCGVNVDGMKFCGECGTKVVLNCLHCNTELIPRAKFCPECGAKRGSSTPAPSPDEPQASSITPPAPATPVQPEPEPIPIKSVSPPTDTPIETSSSEPHAESGRQEIAEPELKEPPSVPVPAAVSTPPKGPLEATIEKLKEDGEGKTSEERKKKAFSVRESPKCAVCGKSVYETERATDSSGTVFHRDCFRCKTCKVHLNGKQRIPEPEVGSIKIANGQYLVAKEGSVLGEKGDFFCDKHTIKARASVVKAQAIDEKARDDAELSRVASLRKDANEEARVSMQVRVGDMLPTCARCGRPIDKGQRAITSGIQKMHESCPTKEESDKAVRTVRWFVRKAPDRLAGTLTCDKETKHPHTFLYELDKQGLTEALKKNGNESALLRYVPDAQARAGASRKLVAPSSDAAREFDMHFKDFQEFSFKNPKEDDKVCHPKLDTKEKDLIVTKFHHSNGVLQTMTAYFKYEESSRLCSAEKVEVLLEMWPPEAAAEMSAQLDPLANLKAHKDGSHVHEVSTTTDTPEATPAAATDAEPPKAVQPEAAETRPDAASSISQRKQSTKGKPRASVASQGKKDCTIM